MLRRTILRKYMQEGGIGKVHPDVMWGWMQGGYLGPGWVSFIKQMPIETFTLSGGSSNSNLHDRVGVVQDPEDPRHPVGTILWGPFSAYDGAFLQMATGGYSPIDQGSRLLQILYDSYLEPFSMHRVCGQLNQLSKVPNHHHLHLEASVEYIGQTASIVGHVMVGIGSTVMEGVTIKADTNPIYIAEGCQILENTCIMSDHPVNPLAYRREENLNPYQVWEGMDGVCKVMQNTIVEPNCVLDSCYVGPFNRIGHNTKIMKGAMTGTMVHILPGSVVLAGTKIGDGELWGGAPAVKLGKISKFEYKRPYFASVLHKENTCEAHRNNSRYGDQVCHWMDAMGKLDTLMIEFDHHVAPTVQAKMKDFVEGREPFHHTITRLAQGWSPADRPEDKAFAQCPPLPGIRNFQEHNTDSKPSKWHGTYLDLTNVFNDFRW